MRTSLCLSLCLLLTACNGTDVGNPPRGELAGFETSPCKKQSFDKGVDPLPAWQPDPNLYAGLTCVLWEADGALLRVRLTNHRDACGLNAGWEPSVRVDDAGVDIMLDNPSCSVAGCGNCIYDLAFDVRVPALSTRRELGLRVLGDDCGEQRPVHQDLRLPLADQTSGVRCAYTFEDFTLLSGMPVGTLHTPCGDSARLGSVACTEGACTEVSTNHRLCLAACDTDADCNPSEAMACTDGLCQLR